MYKGNRPQRTSIKRNVSQDGERIEQKIERIMHNGEPITDGAPLIYTERDQGVQPDYNIRTDRFEAAVEAADAITRSHIATREEKAEAKQAGKVVKLDDKKGGEKGEGEKSGNPSQ